MSKQPTSDTAAKTLPVAEVSPTLTKSASPAPSTPAVNEKALRARGLKQLAAQEDITEQMAFNVFQQLGARRQIKLNEIARQYLNGKLAQKDIAAEVARVKQTAPAKKAAPSVPPDTAKTPAVNEKALRARGLKQLTAQERITEQMALRVFQQISSERQIKLNEVVHQYLYGKLDYEDIAAEVARVKQTAPAKKAAPSTPPDTAKTPAVDEKALRARGLKQLAAQEHITEQMAFNVLQRISAQQKIKLNDVIQRYLNGKLANEQLAAEVARVKQTAPPKKAAPSAPLYASGWLTDHGVVVQESRQPADHDVIWDELALEMGDNYAHLEHLLRTLRQQTSKKDNNEFVLNLSDVSPEQREAVKHFCNRLHSEYAFLRRYHVHKDTETIRLAINVEAMSTHFPFFNGYWFERYVVVRMKNLLEPRHTRYDYLLNTHIQWPDGRKNELDVFFLIAEQPLWIECRAGQVADQLERYVAIRRQLGVPRERSVVLGLTVTDKATVAMTQVHDVTVANLTTFPQHVQAVLS
jgi:hypothetical protein